MLFIIIPSIFSDTFHQSICGILLANSKGYNNA